jgi:hypothetical protein
MSSAKLEQAAGALQMDARWARAAGAPYVAAEVAALTKVPLWWAFELTLNPNASDMRVDDEGAFCIYLNDDVNYGWCLYRPRAASEEVARAAVQARFGDYVDLPVAVAMSVQDVDWSERDRPA